MAITADQASGSPRGQHRVARGHLPDGGDEVAGRGVLEQEPVGARLEGRKTYSSAAKVVSTMTAGPVGRSSSRGGGEAVEPRHPDVHEHDVGPQLGRRRHGLARRRRPPDDLQVGRPPRMKVGPRAPAGRRRRSAPGWSRRHAAHGIQPRSTNRPPSRRRSSGPPRARRARRDHQAQPGAGRGRRRRTRRGLRARRPRRPRVTRQPTRDTAPRACLPALVSPPAPPGRPCGPPRPAPRGLGGRAGRELDAHVRRAGLGRRAPARSATRLRGPGRLAGLGVAQDAEHASQVLSASREVAG